MSSASMDEESCVSDGVCKDDVDDCDGTRPLHPVVNHFPPSESSPPLRSRHRRSGTVAPAPKISMTSSSSSSSSHRQQPQQQQVPLSPRSREYLRLRVNARERQRMHDMNVALDALRRAMPYAQGPAVKKLSKMNTLLLARNYILLLTRTLDELRRLLVSPQTMSQGGAPDVIGRQGLIGGLASSGRARGVTSMDHQNRLEAALRGLIDGAEINAEQQRYAEELVRREQLQLRQEQEQALMTAMTKSSGKNRNRKQQDVKGAHTFDSEISPPDVRRINRKRKLERCESPDSPSRDTPSRRRSPSVVEDKDVVASTTDETPRPVNYMMKYPDERLMQYAMPPPSTSGPLMMMASSRLPEMAAVGFSPAAHQAISSGSSAAVAAAMMGHMISGPFPSCPCPHCADSRPTYIMPIGLVTAAAARTSPTSTASYLDECYNSRECCIELYCESATCFVNKVHIFLQDLFIRFNLSTGYFPYN